jgi:N-acetylneuraminate synthase
MDENSYVLIAEIGASHVGSIERAKSLALLAHQNGADVVKFQKRNPLLSTPESVAHKPHPNPHFSYGNTYLEHRIKLELSIDQHCELKSYCSQIGNKYSCSVWDMDSANQICNIDPFIIKIPSACNLHFNMIDYCLEHASCDIHISLGMTFINERNLIIDRYKKERVVFYHTTSEYPCSFDKLFLLEIKKMKDMGLRVGFSNHGYGIASDIAAISLGASFIERHFIDDRAFRHTDAAASLEPSGLRTLKRDIVNVSKALSYKPDESTEQEQIQAKKLRNIIK